MPSLQTNRPVAVLGETSHLTPHNWQDPALRGKFPAVAGLTSGGHALPLMPIRGRDVQAMSELFDIQDIAEIERDIHKNLTWRYPEPYWGDEVFSFLSHFL